MRYFRDPDGQVYAYDEQDETQHPYMLEAVKAGWTLEAAMRECCARGWQGFKVSPCHIYSSDS